MKRLLFFNLIFAVLGTFLTVQIATASNIQIVFDQPVEILKPNAQGLSEPEKVEAEKPYDLANDKVVWIQSKGFVPVLVVPQEMGVKGEPLKIKMAPVATWPNTETSTEIDRKLSLLTDEIVAFQAAVRSKNVTEAEKILSRMEAISRQDYYHFFRASIQFLKGDINSAKDSTKRGLSRFPANENGLKFLQVLEKKQ